MRWLWVLAILGCGSSEDQPKIEPEPEVPTPAPEAIEPEVPAEPETPPVNLLENVPTEVAVSSAYRDRDREIPKLFDGDLETAWNSKTDDLQGAWIDVRIPDDATVTSIEMTAGYTKTDAHGTDLFMGNHRVARVRITHGGQELASHALDTSSRELQTIPVSGPGGIYRIEVAEVATGERSDWKETCISELRVMGRAAEPREGFFPRWSIGALPAPRVVAARPNDNALRLGTHQFAAAWADYEYQTIPMDLSSGDPGLDDLEREEAASLRRRALAPLQELFGSVSAGYHVDRIRRLASLPVSSNWWAEHRGELDEIAAGFDALVEGDTEATCRWAKSHAHLRLNRIARVLEREREIADQDGTEDLSDVAAEVEDASVTFKDDAQTTTRRVLRMERPSPTSIHADWDAMRPSLELAQRTCGW